MSQIPSYSILTQMVIATRKFILANYQKHSLIKQNQASFSFYSRMSVHLFLLRIRSEVHIVVSSKILHREQPSIINIFQLKICFQVLIPLLTVFYNHQVSSVSQSRLLILNNSRCLIYQDYLIVAMMFLMFLFLGSWLKTKLHTKKSRM